MNVSSSLIIATILAVAALSAPAVDPSTKPAVPDDYVIRVSGMGLNVYTYGELRKAAELTSEQQAKFAKIEQQRVEQNKEKIKTLDDAKAAAKDHPGLETSARLNNATMALYEVDAKTQAQMLALLTPAQKARWQAYVILRAFKAAYADMDLSESQWDEILSTCEKLAKNDSLTPYRMLRRLIVKGGELLTPQQRSKRTLAKYQKQNEACHLTDEQVRKIGKIEQERLAEVTRADEQLGTQIDKLHDDCRAALAAKDVEAFEAAQTKIGQLGRQVGELDAKYDKKVQDLLTEQQKKAWPGGAGK